MKKLSLPSSINSPLPTSLKGEYPGQGLDIVIPSTILDKAQGLAIFTVLKAGFLFSGRVGSGLVVARLPDGSWSAPSAIITGGMGAGGQIGAELTDFVLVLNTKEAVKTFSHFGNITLGGNVSIAAGPIGRNAEASGSATLKHIAAVYSYSKTRGLFAGISLEGSVIFTRNDANEKLYGQRYSAKELLNGTVPPPHEADALYRALNAKFHSLGSTGIMYQRTINQNENERLYRNTSISAPGTLRIPPARQVVGSYGAPNINPSNTTVIPPPMKEQSIYNTPPSSNYTSPQPSFAQLSSSYSPSLQKSNSHRAVPPPPPSQASKPQRARALYQFIAEQKGDLSFQQGDIIVITNKTDNQNDWWTGKLCTTGQIGSFPANYVELI
ncbi:uncharacterized protein BX663DRAFT_576088 [Cokeromyces recurvatus]|uniref:uncharacterized protein n=1 Tax=Cokeromyces recurvatus TaxID=90255 RepID=UPI00221FFFC1|nr:uncharacterized protein BX663DRAFT_576088 [Cokeromyces recurvatus]KAI7899983.1 hypothetical protein BX663DRAFT_576088 [Cokeromyces recurvatus]